MFTFEKQNSHAVHFFKFHENFHLFQHKILIFSQFIKTNKTTCPQIPKRGMTNFLLKFQTHLTNLKNVK